MYSKVIIPNLNLTKVCAILSPDDYSVEPHPDFARTEYHHFPVVLNPDGSPWRHATLYLLSKLESIKQPSNKTLDCIAGDLLAFRNFIDGQGINYLEFPKRKLRRPTYLYRAELQSQMEAGKMSPSTAKRKLSSVVCFYRWLEQQADVQFEYPLWQEKEVYIHFPDDKGFDQSKRVASTDLSVRIPKNSNQFDEYIEDGGRLKPLSKEQQYALVTALKSIGNIEMTLAFIVALTTGARMQTVFTLRMKHVLTDLESGQSEVRVHAGMGTGVDTKYQKQMVIFIPKWLQLKLKTYALSERANRRQSITKHQFDSFDEHYLFLTSHGAPYYIAENDSRQIDYRIPPRGSAVRKFIATELQSELRRLGTPISFSFHDLRATYGLNLLESKLAQVEMGKTKLFDVLMLIKERMGHSKITTTEHYLNYRKTLDLTVAMQSEFEEYLMELI